MKPSNKYAKELTARYIAAKSTTVYIVRSDRGFWTGTQWSDEFPDARQWAEYDYNSAEKVADQVGGRAVPVEIRVD